MTSTFWQEVDRQLERIETEKPDTFAAVRVILLDSTYGEIQRDIHLNGARVFSDRAAFFAGSGGERTLSSALREAGWRQLWCEASYHYAMYSPLTLEVLTYTEGDIDAGNRRVAQA